MDQNVGGVNLLMIGFLEMVVVMFVYGYDKWGLDQNVFRLITWMVVVNFS